MGREPLTACLQGARAPVTPNWLRLRTVTHAINRLLNTGPVAGTEGSARPPFALKIIDGHQARLLKPRQGDRFVATRRPGSKARPSGARLGGAQLGQTFAQRLFRLAGVAFRQLVQRIQHDFAVTAPAHIQTVCSE